MRIRQGATEAAEQGIRLQLLCQLSQGGDPGHGVTWLHNGAALTSSSADVAWAPGAAYNEYVLTIRNVSSSDGGRYECQAGRHASSSFNLHGMTIGAGFWRTIGFNVHSHYLHMETHFNRPRWSTNYITH